MELPEQSDKALITTVGKTVAKCVLYICIATVSITWLTTRQLDSDTVTNCEDACGMHRGIKEVTATSCECNGNLEITESPWVLPK